MSEDQSQSKTSGARRPGPRKFAPKLSCLTCGPLTLDMDSMYVTKGGVAIKLTPKECQLLTAFMSHPGQILPRELLIKEIWHTDYTGDMRMLHVHIRWLREKIEDDPSRPLLVQTVRGRGYRFVPPETTEI